MERKIVQHGPATLMVSLPAKWVKKKGLKKGDEINIEEKENHLIIGPDKKKYKSETTLNLTSLEESSIRTIITNAYRLGYDKITITFKQKEILSIIKTLVEKNLLGFEITKKDEKGCTIESITEPSIEQFDNIFSKVFMNIEELFEIVKSTFKGEKQEYEDVSRKTAQLDNFCKRVIIKNSTSDVNFLDWHFHSKLIHASRELRHLLKYLSKTKFKAKKLELDLLSKVKKVFDLTKEAYEHNDIPLLEKVHDLEKKITYKDGYSALKKSKDPIIINHLITSAKHFYLANSPLMGSIINKR